MSKAIWHEKQILIVLLWSVLIFIGYNVITAPNAYSEKTLKTAFLDEDYDWDEFYDSEYDRNIVDEVCDASEDYKANKKACDKAYDKIEKQEKDTVENCEAGGGKWIEDEDSSGCVIINDDNVKEFNKFLKDEKGIDPDDDYHWLSAQEQGKLQLEFQDEEIGKELAAIEDDICDDEDADTTDIDMCKSDDMMFGQAFAEKYNKENCEDNNGEWIDGECDFYENQMKEGWEVDEDNFYKEVCSDEKNESDECKKHRLSIEDGE